MSSIVANAYRTYQRKKADAPLLYILFGYLVLSIFYVFRSGMPQPADFLMVLGIGCAGIGFMTQMRSKFPGVYVSAVLFGVFTLVINLVHYKFLPDKTFLLSSLYYLYNVTIFMFVSHLMIKYPEVFRKYLYYGVVVSIFVEFFLVIAFGAGGRETGSFNNPNQFSYWALLSTCLLLMARYPKKLEVLDYLLLLLLGYMIIIGLSKSAFISFCFIMLFGVMSRMLSPALRYILVFAGLVVLIFGVFSVTVLQDNINQVAVLANMSERIGDIGKQSDDSLEGRGYYRIIQHPEYLFFGAGEGGYGRFITQGFPYALEMHSGLGTMLFSYGIFGFLLFSWFMFSIFRSLPVMFWVLLASIMFYGLTHQNMRFSHTWVFFGVCYGIAYTRKQEQRIKPPDNYLADT
jgi:hypothetical protein